MNDSSALLHRFAATGFMTLWMLGTAQAGNIPVPNGDFSESRNVGSIGGGIVTFIYNETPLGSGVNPGPWSARSNGIDLGIASIAAPLVSIGSGTTGALVFHEIFTLDLLGLQIGRANAFVATESLYQSTTRYTLEFDYYSAGLTELDLLAQTGFVFGLQSNTTAYFTGADIVSNLTSPELLDLGVLVNNGGRARFTYETGEIAPNGTIGISFGIGADTGVLSVDALSALAIDNVTLTATLIPEPGISLLLSASALLPLQRRRKNVR